MTTAAIDLRTHAARTSAGRHRRALGAPAAHRPRAHASSPWCSCCRSRVVRGSAFRKGIAAYLTSLTRSDGARRAIQLTLIAAARRGRR